MLGSGLYYPYIDIHDPKWLRSAVLFWDSLQTIAPRAVRNPYTNRDTRILWKEGFLEPLRCDLHPELLDTLGKRVFALMDSGKLRSKVLRDDLNDATLTRVREARARLNEYFLSAKIHPKKLSPELMTLALRAGLTRIHPQKLSPEMRLLLNEMKSIGADGGERAHVQYANRFEDDEGDWLLVDNQFADVYMAALAALLAQEGDIAALTNEETSMAVNLHTLLEHVRPSVKSDKKGALVSLVMKTIAVDPETSVEKLLSFRRSKEDQLAELSAQFDEISSKIPDCETAKELEEKAGKVYRTKIKPKLGGLKRELADHSIQAVWEGFYRAATITVPAGGALAYFSGWTGSVLLGAGAALTVTDVLVKSHMARKKARRASPYTYLLDIDRKFSSQRAAH